MVLRFAHPRHFFRVSSGVLYGITRDDRRPDIGGPTQ